VVDAKASQKHLAFVRTGSTLAVEDLGSRNGTYVDGVRIAPRERVPIDDGAVLRVGQTLFVYREAFMGDDAPSAPLGELVGPFGLRAFADALRALRARPRCTVLVLGETGTGKELAAQLIAAGLGRTKPYGAVNVAAVPSGVFESQLFGYVAGAYSGSGKGSPGLFVAHDGGAVFLDEIGELTPDLQPKLLRFLENREVMPVGATRPTTADVLVIAATLRPLEALVREGRFRSDLVARFGVPIELPALRDRVEDIFTLVRALAHRRNESYEATRVEVEAMERLLLHDWPRNVRELSSVLDAVAAHAPPPALPYWAVERVLGTLPVSSAAPLTSEVVHRVLAQNGGNESAAARALGISRGKLRRFLRR
jgi:transcriptional regulator with PAS, ATPase and Fis domain